GVEAFAGRSAGSGDTLVGPNADAFWALSGQGAGTIAGTGFAYRFNHFGNLTGGGGGDVFAFADGSGVGGILDGGGGTNRLDYTACTSDLFVNLKAAVATGTGGMRHFTQVYGGRGNDILVGDGNGVLLVDLVGDNLLIGGSGQATLVGGPGEDI